MQPQEIENAFDPIELIRQFNNEGVRYILIGRQAVVQYGAPLFSFDYDFWIHPEDRAKVYEILESFGLSSKYTVNERKPLDSFVDDEGNKVDTFFTKTMEKASLDISLKFDDVYASSVIKEDPKSDFYVRIPSIDDLIQLKKIGEIRPKDKEDIEYLETIKALKK
jgi:hypothetical protein